MTLINTFDTNTPLGTNAPDVIDDRIREVKKAIQERMNDHNRVKDAGDHYWSLNGTQVDDADTGEHRKVTLRTLTAEEVAALDPTKAVIYRLVTDGEYYLTDGAGHTIQLTQGGLTAIGHRQTAKTGDYNVLAGDLKGNKTFTNTGAAAVVTFNLPLDAVAGDRVAFLVTDTDGIRIDPSLLLSFYMIYVGTSTAGKYITASTLGSYIELEFDGTYWVIVNIIGVWEEET